MPAAVVFDFDGTLIDSNAIKRQGYFEVVAALDGDAALMRSVLAEVSGDRSAILAAYRERATRAGSKTALPSVEAMVRSYGEHVDVRVAAADEMSNASALLRKLRSSGRRVYLSSATPLTSLRRIVERRQWTSMFDDVFGHPVSKRETLARILDSNGLGPSSLAVVGDGEDDRDSAEFVGCAFYSVGEGRGARAGERIFTLAELIDILTAPVERSHAK